MHNIILEKQKSSQVFFDNPEISPCLSFVSDHSRQIRKSSNLKSRKSKLCSHHFFNYPKTPHNTTQFIASNVSSNSTLPYSTDPPPSQSMLGLISEQDFEKATQFPIKDELDSELFEEDCELELMGRLAEVEEENDSRALIVQQMITQILEEEARNQNQYQQENKFSPNEKNNGIKQDLN